MEVRNVSEQWDTGRIHEIRVHNRIHSADKNTAVQQKFTNYPTQRKNQRDYPPESYKRYNKRASQEKEKTTTVNSKSRQLAQPQTLTQGIIQLERTNLFDRYIMMKQTGLNWAMNQTPNKRQAPFWGLAWSEKLEHLTRNT